MKVMNGVLVCQECLMGFAKCPDMNVGVGMYVVFYRRQVTSNDGCQM